MYSRTSSSYIMDIDPDIYDENFNPCPTRLRVKEETSRKLQEMLREAASSDFPERSHAPLERHERKRKREETSSSQDIPTTPTKIDRRFEVIPETPEDKLIIREEHYNEVVPQTPMSKLIQANRRRSTKLYQLLIKSEERNRRRTIIASEPVKKKSKPMIASSVSKESLLAHYCQPKKKKAHRSLQFSDQFLI